MYLPILLSCLCLHTLGHCATVTISAPQVVPSTKAVPHSFTGLGINGEFLPDFAGNESRPNTFFANLVATIAERTGSDVFLRIGGTSLDHALFNASQPFPVKSVKDEHRPSKVYTIVGPSWFTSFAPLKKLALKYVYQLPLTVGTIENTLEFGKRGLAAFGNRQLHAIEIGNEPNLGEFKKPTDYVDRWLRFAKAVSGALTSIPPGPIYQGLVLASEATPPWTVSNIFEKGIDRLQNIKSVSLHLQACPSSPTIKTNTDNHPTSYEVFPDRNGQDPITNAPQYLQSTLLNHTYTIKAASGLKSATDYLTSTHPNIPLILGETGSGLAGGNRNETATRQILASLGTALWTLDFHLYCMSIGIGGISNQVGETKWNFAPFNARPSELVPTAVRPQWYGIVAAADFLGNETAKPTRVSPIPVPGAAAALHVTAYASFRGGDLATVAILNLELWDRILHPGTTRPQTDIQLKDLPEEVRTVRVSKLTGPGGLAQDGTTWGEERWTYQSGGKAVKVGKGVETVQVRDRAVNLSVGATEAIVVSLVR